MSSFIEQVLITNLLCVRSHSRAGDTVEKKGNNRYFSSPHKAYIPVGRDMINKKVKCHPEN